VAGDRRTWLAAWEPRLPLVAGGLVTAIALATITPAPVGVFWDDGVYLIGAKALASGAGYRFAHLPGAPPAVHFPPGYPALLALVWTLSPGFPANVSTLKLVNPLLLGLAAGLAAAWGARRLTMPPLVAAGAAIVFSASLPLLVVTGVLFSEPLFLVVLFTALLLADRAADAGGWWPALSAGVAAGVLVLVRTAGLAFLPALVVGLLVVRRRREAAAAAATAVAVITPWQIWLASRVEALAPPLRGSYGPYLDWVLKLYRQRGAGFALTVMRENLLALFRTLGIALFPFGPRGVRPLLVALVIVVAVVALISARRRAAAAAPFLGGYFALVLAWPYAPDRFLWAVWPLVGMLVASGAVASWRLGSAAGARALTRATVSLACAVGVISLAGHIAYSVRGVARHWWDLAARTNAAALTPVAAWINTHTAPEDVIACDGEPFVHLYTGRTVVPVHILSPDEYLAGTPIAQAAEDLRTLFTANRPRYAVFSAAAGELGAAALLDGANGTPRLVPLDTLPGGGAAFRVVLP
jgi:hypothetical protein